MNEEPRPLTGPQIAAAAVLLLAFVATLAVSASAVIGKSRHVSAAAVEPSAATYVARIHEALAGRQISVAAFEWENAHAAALASRDWPDLIAVGDVALAIGDATGTRVGWTAKARDCYRSALHRARAHGSLDGVLTTAQVFAGLGDSAGAAQGIAVARALAPDPTSRARVQDAASRLDQRIFATADAPRRRF